MKIIKTILVELVIIILAFIFIWTFIFIDRALGLTSIQSIWLIIVGSGIMLFAIILRFWAVQSFYAGGITFLSFKAQNNIIKKAPFTFTRNPMMLSNILVALAAVLIIGSITGFIIPFVVFLISHLWAIFYEEKDLERKLGKEYLDYKKEVRRWL